MMSVRCPTSITNPRGSAYKEDHEDWRLGANVVADVMPFCGRVSTKNSLTLFNEGRGKLTVNLLFYGKVNAGSVAKFFNCVFLRRTLVSCAVVTYYSAKN